MTALAEFAVGVAVVFVIVTRLAWSFRMDRRPNDTHPAKRGQA